MGQYTTEFTENLMRQHNDTVAELHQLEQAHSQAFTRITVLDEKIAKQSATINTVLRLVGRQSEARQAAERERDELAEFVLDRWPFNAGRSVTGSLRLQKARDAFDMKLPLILDDEGNLRTSPYRNALAARQVYVEPQKCRHAIYHCGCDWCNAHDVEAQEADHRA